MLMFSNLFHCLLYSLSGSILISAVILLRLVFTAGFIDFVYAPVESVGDLRFLYGC